MLNVCSPYIFIVCVFRWCLRSMISLWIIFCLLSKTHSKCYTFLLWPNIVNHQWIISVAVRFYSWDLLLLLMLFLFLSYCFVCHQTISRQKFVQRSVLRRIIYNIVVFDKHYSSWTLPACNVPLHANQMTRKALVKLVDVGNYIEWDYISTEYE